MCNLACLTCHFCLLYEVRSKAVLPVTISCNYLLVTECIKLKIGKRPRREILTLEGEGRRFHYSGSYPMVFQHSGARDSDLGGGFYYSGSYPMMFQHSGARDFDLGGGFHYSTQ